VDAQTNEYVERSSRWGFQDPTLTVEDQQETGVQEVALDDLQSPDRCWTMTRVLSRHSLRDGSDWHKRVAVVSMREEEAAPSCVG
jgi:hypothetical protein